MPKWEIRYYLTESAYKLGVVAFKEVMQGNRYFIVNWAKNRIKISNYKYFEIIEKK